MTVENKRVLELVIYEDGHFRLYDVKNDRAVEGKTNPTAVVASFLLMTLASIGTK